MKLCAFAALLFALPVWAGPITADHMSTLPAADVVVLGEVHDNPDHHANQARAVRAIAPKALVFEMLTPDQTARMPQDRSESDKLAAALQWDAAGWPNFALYHPIFLASPDARVYGANVPREALRAAIAQGAATAFGLDAARYGLDKALLPEDQAAREAEQAEAHCGALPPEMLPGMVQAQRLRDAALARATETALRETGGPVVVITGTGHARRDTGLPAVLALADPTLAVLSVGQLESDPGSDAPFDLWLITPPTPRPDPCLAFGG
jgi:uncharacterized iron-regulated protein